ncbi:hypothetical protein [Helicobacter typhlonius]|uniref:CHASE3 domain-containing protein n=1 Tax=Helicobacter typhlonius TaxID=76936 RepID=UPI002FE33291
MSFFRSWSIGAKIILCFSSILVVCMFIVTTITVIISHNIQEEESNKMLINAAKREANWAEGIFNGIYTAMNASRGFILRDVQNGAQAILENDIMDMFDSNEWGILPMFISLKMSDIKAQISLIPSINCPMVILWF